jgi:hypothetical protein
MNVVPCVYSLDSINVCIRCTFFDINVMDGVVFFYIIFIMNLLFIIDI